MNPRRIIESCGIRRPEAGANSSSPEWIFAGKTAAAAASKEEASALVQQISDLQTTLESSEVLTAKLGLTHAELETTATLLSLARQKEELLGAEIATAKRQVAAAAQDAER